MSNRLRISTLFVLAILPVATGCSKEKLSELVDKTKQTVSQGAQQVQQSVQSATGTAKEQLSLAGQAQLKLDAPLETSGCYAFLLEGGGERPRVIQLRSYRDTEHETFPSLLFQGEVGATTPNELAGQVIAGQLYVQRDASGPVWHTAAGASVELKLVAVDNQTLTAEIVGGNLRSTETDAEQTVTGTFSAVWP